MKIEVICLISCVLVFSSINNACADTYNMLRLNLAVFFYEQLMVIRRIYCMGTIGVLPDFVATLWKMQSRCGVHKYLALSPFFCLIFKAITELFSFEIFYVIFVISFVIGCRNG